MPSLAPLTGLVEEKGERKTSDVGFLDLSDLKEQLFIIMNQKYKILLKTEIADIIWLNLNVQGK